MLLVLGDLLFCLVDRNVLRLGDRVSGSVTGLFGLRLIASNSSTHGSNGGVAKSRRVVSARSITDVLFDT